MGKIIIGNFKGPQGDQGEKGDQGEQGIQGPAGPMGQVDATTPIAFDTPATYEELTSGDAISTLFGKIKKGLSDIFAKLTNHSEEINTNATSISELYSNLTSLTSSAATTQYVENVKANDLVGSSSGAQFYVFSGDTGTTANDFPVNSGGYLLVMNMYNTHWFQVFFAVGNNNMYFRNRLSSGSWSAWKLVTATTVS